MDLSTLGLLAKTGFAGVSANRLGDLANWCDDWCRATGDGRYCILAATFRHLHEWWSEHDKYNGIPVSLARSIDQTISRHLSGILEERDLAASAGLAAVFEGEIINLLSLPYSWPLRTSD
jgi:hypothetical protein